MTTVYGLKTCDGCRKARKALDAAGASYAYRDVRDDGVARRDLTRWAEALEANGGWLRLVNKASTTWRGLPDADKTDLTKARAIALIAAHPTLLKRPLFELADGRVLVGWTPEAKAALLG